MTRSQQQQPFSDSELSDLAVELVLAMMRSASTEQISPLDWWPRARSALETASSVARTWPQMISRMGKKLEIGSLKSVTARDVARIGADLSDPADWRRFRYLCRRDALYLVAMAQVRRDEQRAAAAEYDRADVAAAEAAGRGSFGTMEDLP
jgi:hypothetical protein